jgi:RNA polymerase sigma factor (sigma-70 family)
MEARALPVELHNVKLSTIESTVDPSTVDPPTVDPPTVAPSTVDPPSVSEKSKNRETKLFLSSFSSSSYSTFLKSVSEATQNGNQNGNGRVNVFLGGGDGVGGGLGAVVVGVAAGGVEVDRDGKKKVLTKRDWDEMWDYVVSSSFVREEVKKRCGYISGITVEDLVRDALVVGMEELKKCKESNFCSGCEWSDCAVWVKRFQISYRRTLKRLQDLGRKNGRVSYLELVEEENGSERLPTTYRRDWDMTANWALDPLMQLCAEEEKREKVDKENERIKKVREVLKKLKKKERDVWELLLSGMSLPEIAKRLGYKRVQGVYMVIRRTTRKLRRLLRDGGRQ